MHFVPDKFLEGARDGDRNFDCSASEDGDEAVEKEQRTGRRMATRKLYYAASWRR